LVPITVIGMKNISLEKKRKNREYLLKILLISAEYLPTVSPMLYIRRMRITDQLVSRPLIFLSREGPGNRIKVITKVNMIIR
jgi:hypothetical protein